MASYASFIDTASNSAQNGIAAWAENGLIYYALWDPEADAWGEAQRINNAAGDGNVTVTSGHFIHDPQSGLDIPAVLISWERGRNNGASLYGVIGTYTNSGELLFSDQLGLLPEGITVKDYSVGIEAGGDLLIAVNSQTVIDPVGADPTGLGPEAYQDSDINLYKLRLERNEAPTLQNRRVVSGSQYRGTLKNLLQSNTGQSGSSANGELVRAWVNGIEIPIGSETNLQGIGTLSLSADGLFVFDRGRNAPSELQISASLISNISSSSTSGRTNTLTSALLVPKELIPAADSPNPLGADAPDITIAVSPLNQFGNPIATSRAPLAYQAVDQRERVTAQTFAPLRSQGANSYRTFSASGLLSSNNIANQGQINQNPGNQFYQLADGYADTSEAIGGVFSGSTWQTTLLNGLSNPFELGPRYYLQHTFSLKRILTGLTQNQDGWLSRATAKIMENRLISKVGAKDLQLLTTLDYLKKAGTGTKPNTLTSRSTIKFYIENFDKPEEKPNAPNNNAPIRANSDRQRPPSLAEAMPARDSSEMHRYSGGGSIFSASGSVEMSKSSRGGSILSRNAVMQVDWHSSIASEHSSLVAARQSGLSWANMKDLFGESLKQSALKTNHTTKRGNLFGAPRIGAIPMPLSRIGVYGSGTRTYQYQSSASIGIQPLTLQKTYKEFGLLAMLSLGGNIDIGEFAPDIPGNPFFNVDYRADFEVNIGWFENNKYDTPIAIDPRLSSDSPLAFGTFDNGAIDSRSAEIAYYKTQSTDFQKFLLIAHLIGQYGSSITTATKNYSEAKARADALQPNNAGQPDNAKLPKLLAWSNTGSESFSLIGNIPLAAGAFGHLFNKTRTGDDFNAEAKTGLSVLLNISAKLNATLLMGAVSGYGKASFGLKYSLTSGGLSAGMPYNLELGYSLGTTSKILYSERGNVIDNENYNSTNQHRNFATDQLNYELRLPSSVSTASNQPLLPGNSTLLAASTASVQGDAVVVNDQRGITQALQEYNSSDSTSPVLSSYGVITIPTIPDDLSSEQRSLLLDNKGNLNHFFLSFQSDHATADALKFFLDTRALAPVDQSAGLEQENAFTARLIPLADGLTRITLSPDESSETTLVSVDLAQLFELQPGDTLPFQIDQSLIASSSSTDLSLPTLSLRYSTTTPTSSSTPAAADFLVPPTGMLAGTDSAAPVLRDEEGSAYRLGDATSSTINQAPQTVDPYPTAFVITDGGGSITTSSEDFLLTAPSSDGSSTVTVRGRLLNTNSNPSGAIDSADLYTTAESKAWATPAFATLELSDFSARSASGSDATLSLTTDADGIITAIAIPKGRAGSGYFLGDSGAFTVAITPDGTPASSSSSSYALIRVAVTDGIVTSATPLFRKQVGSFGANHSPDSASSELLIQVPNQIGGLGSGLTLNLLTRNSLDHNYVDETDVNIGGHQSQFINGQYRSDAILSYTQGGPTDRDTIKSLANKDNLGLNLPLKVHSYIQSSGWRNISFIAPQGVYTPGVDGYSFDSASANLFFSDQEQTSALLFSNANTHFITDTRDLYLLPEALKDSSIYFSYRQSDSNNNWTLSTPQLLSDPSKGGSNSSGILQPFFAIQDAGVAPLYGKNNQLLAAWVHTPKSGSNAEIHVRIGHVTTGNAADGVSWGEISVIPVTNGINAENLTADAITNLSLTYISDQPVLSWSLRTQRPFQAAALDQQPDTYYRLDDLPSQGTIANIAPDALIADGVIISGNELSTVSSSWLGQLSSIPIDSAAGALQRVFDAEDPKSDQTGDLNPGLAFSSGEYALLPGRSTDALLDPNREPASGFSAILYVKPDAASTSSADNSATPQIASILDSGLFNPDAALPTAEQLSLPIQLRRVAATEAVARLDDAGNPLTDDAGNLLTDTVNGYRYTVYLPANSFADIDAAGIGSGLSPFNLSFLAEETSLSFEKAASGEGAALSKTVELNTTFLDSILSYSLNTEARLASLSTANDEAILTTFFEADAASPGDPAANGDSADDKTTAELIEFDSKPNLAITTLQLGGWSLRQRIESNGEQFVDFNWGVDANGVPLTLSAPITPEQWSQVAISYGTDSSLDPVEITSTGENGETSTRSVFPAAARLWINGVLQAQAIDDPQDPAVFSFLSTDHQLGYGYSGSLDELILNDNPLTTPSRTFSDLELSRYVNPNTATEATFQSTGRFLTSDQQWVWDEAETFRKIDYIPSTIPSAINPGPVDAAAAGDSTTLRPDGKADFTATIALNNLAPASILRGIRLTLSNGETFSLGAGRRVQRDATGNTVDIREDERGSVLALLADNTLLNQGSSGTELDYTILNNTATLQLFVPVAGANDGDILTATSLDLYISSPSQQATGSDVMAVRQLISPTNTVAFSSTTTTDTSSILSSYYNRNRIETTVTRALPRSLMEIGNGFQALLANAVEPSLPNTATASDANAPGPLGQTYAESIAHGRFSNLNKLGVNTPYSSLDLLAIANPSLAGIGGNGTSRGVLWLLPTADPNNAANSNQIEQQLQQLKNLIAAPGAALSSDLPGLVIEGRNLQSIGSSVLFADLTGDGIPELIIGASQAQNSDGSNIHGELILIEGRHLATRLLNKQWHLNLSDLNKPDSTLHNHVRVIQGASSSELGAALAFGAIGTGGTNALAIGAPGFYAPVNKAVEGYADYDPNGPDGNGYSVGAVYTIAANNPDLFNREVSDQDILDVSTPLITGALEHLANGNYGAEVTPRRFGQTLAITSKQGDFSGDQIADLAIGIPGLITKTQLLAGINPKLVDSEGRINADAIESVIAQAITLPPGLKWPAGENGKLDLRDSSTLDEILDTNTGGVLLLAGGLASSSSAEKAKKVLLIGDTRFGGDAAAGSALATGASLTGNSIDELAIALPSISWSNGQVNLIDGATIRSWFDQATATNYGNADLISTEEKTKGTILQAGTIRSAALDATLSITGGANTQQYGSALSLGGDINGDGSADLVIGDRFFDNQSGRVNVIFGAPDLATIAPDAESFTAIGTTATSGSTSYSINLDVPDVERVLTFYSAAQGQQLGTSLLTANLRAPNSAFDTQIDPLADLILPTSSAGSTLNVVVGKPYLNQIGGFNLQDLGGATGYEVARPNNPEETNSSFAFLGDINGDGLSDAFNRLVTSAPAFGISYGGNSQANPNQNDAGTGGAGGLNLANQFGVQLGGSADTRITSVHRAGDLNADGIGDLIINTESTPSYSLELNANGVLSLIGPGNTVLWSAEHHEPTGYQFGFSTDGKTDSGFALQLSSQSDAFLQLIDQASGESTWQPKLRLRSGHRNYRNPVLLAQADGNITLSITSTPIDPRRPTYDETYTAWALGDSNNPTERWNFDSTLKRDYSYLLALKPDGTLLRSAYTTAADGSIQLLDDSDATYPLNQVIHQGDPGSSSNGGQTRYLLPGEPLALSGSQNALFLATNPAFKLVAPNGSTLWSPEQPIAGGTIDRITMLENGNLVAYNTDNEAIWSLDDAPLAVNRGNHLLVLEPDGTLRRSAYTIADDGSIELLDKSPWNRNTVIYSAPLDATEIGITQYLLPSESIFLNPPSESDAKALLITQEPETISPPPIADQLLMQADGRLALIAADQPTLFFAANKIFQSPSRASSDGDVLLVLEPNGTLRLSAFAIGTDGTPELINGNPRNQILYQAPATNPVLGERQLLLPGSFLSRAGNSNDLPSALTVQGTSIASSHVLLGGDLLSNNAFSQYAVPESFQNRSTTSNPAFNRLLADQALNPGEALQSPNGLFTALMQPSGNFIITQAAAATNGSISTTLLSLAALRDANGEPFSVDITDEARQLGNTPGTNLLASASGIAFRNTTFITPALTQFVPFTADTSSLINFTSAEQLSEPDSAFSYLQLNDLGQLEAMSSSGEVLYTFGEAQDLSDEIHNNPSTFDSPIASVKTSDGRLVQARKDPNSTTLQWRFSDNPGQIEEADWSSIQAMASPNHPSLALHKGAVYLAHQGETGNGEIYITRLNQESKLWESPIQLKGEASDRSRGLALVAENGQLRVFFLDADGSSRLRTATGSDPMDPGSWSQSQMVTINVDGQEQDLKAGSDFIAVSANGNTTYLSVATETSPTERKLWKANGSSASNAPWKATAAEGKLLWIDPTAHGGNTVLSLKNHADSTSLTPLTGTLPSGAATLSGLNLARTAEGYLVNLLANTDNLALDIGRLFSEWVDQLLNRTPDLSTDERASIESFVGILAEQLRPLENLSTNPDATSYDNLLALAQYLDDEIAPGTGASFRNYVAAKHPIYRHDPITLFNASTQTVIDSSQYECLLVDRNGDGHQELLLTPLDKSNTDHQTLLFDLRQLSSDGLLTLTEPLTTPQATAFSWKSTQPLPLSTTLIGDAATTDTTKFGGVYPDITFSPDTLNNHHPFLLQLTDHGRDKSGSVSIPIGDQNTLNYIKSNQAFEFKIPAGYFQARTPAGAKPVGDGGDATWFHLGSEQFKNGINDGSALDGLAIEINEWNDSFKIWWNGTEIINTSNFTVRQIADMPNRNNYTNNGYAMDSQSQTAAYKGSWYDNLMTYGLYIRYQPNTNETGGSLLVNAGSAARYLATTSGYFGIRPNIINKGFEWKYNLDESIHINSQDQLALEGRALSGAAQGFHALAGIAFNTDLPISGPTGLELSSLQNVGDLNGDGLDDMVGLGKLSSGFNWQYRSDDDQYPYLDLASHNQANANLITFYHQSTSSRLDRISRFNSSNGKSIDQIHLNSPYIVWGNSTGNIDYTDISPIILGSTKSFLDYQKTTDQGSLEHYANFTSLDNIQIKGSSDYNADGFDDLLITDTGLDPDSGGTTFILYGNRDLAEATSYNNWFGTFFGIAGTQNDIFQWRDAAPGGTFDPRSNAFMRDGGKFRYANLQPAASGLGFSTAIDRNGALDASYSASFKGINLSLAPEGVHVDRFTGVPGTSIDGIDGSGNTNDFNGDGIADLYINTEANAGAKLATESAYILYGNQDLVIPGATEITGTPYSDSLKGTVVNDIILGLAGDDILQGFGGLDVLNGGPGNDLIYVTGDQFRFVNGGSGTDALALRGSLDQSWDFTALANRIENIESISLEHYGANNLILNAAALAAITSSEGTLFVDGDQHPLSPAETILKRLQERRTDAALTAEQQDLVSLTSNNYAAFSSGVITDISLLKDLSQSLQLQRLDQALYSLQFPDQASPLSVFDSQLRGINAALAEDFAAYTSNTLFLTPDALLNAYGSWFNDRLNASRTSSSAAASELEQILLEDTTQQQLNTLLTDFSTLFPAYFSTDDTTNTAASEEPPLTVQARSFIDLSLLVENSSIAALSQQWITSLREQDSQQPGSLSADQQALLTADLSATTDAMAFLDGLRSDMADAVASRYDRITLSSEFSLSDIQYLAETSWISIYSAPSGQTLMAPSWISVSIDPDLTTTLTPTDPTRPQANTADADSTDPPLVPALLQLNADTQQSAQPISIAVSTPTVNRKAEAITYTLTRSGDTTGTTRLSAKTVGATHDLIPTFQAEVVFQPGVLSQELAIPLNLQSELEQQSSIWLQQNLEEIAQLDLTLLPTQDNGLRSTTAHALSVYDGTATFISDTAETIDPAQLLADANQNLALFSADPLKITAKSLDLDANGAADAPMLFSVLAPAGAPRASTALIQSTTGDWITLDAADQRSNDLSLTLEADLPPQLAGQNDQIISFQISDGGVYDLDQTVNGDVSLALLPAITTDTAATAASMPLLLATGLAGTDPQRFSALEANLPDTHQLLWVRATNTSDSLAELISKLGAEQILATPGQTSLQVNPGDLIGALLLSGIEPETWLNLPAPSRLDGLQDGHTWSLTTADSLAADGTFSFLAGNASIALRRQEIDPTTDPRDLPLRGTSAPDIWSDQGDATGLSFSRQILSTGAGADQLGSILTATAAGLGANLLLSGSGSDTLFPGQHDLAYAGSGDDTVALHARYARTDTGSGDDTVTLHAGAQLLITGSGDDTIINATTATSTNNGQLASLVQSGSGSDLFVLTSPEQPLPAAPLVITDFDPSFDRFQLDHRGPESLDFSSTTEGGALRTTISLYSESSGSVDLAVVHNLSIGQLTNPDIYVTPGPGSTALDLNTSSGSSLPSADGNTTGILHSDHLISTGSKGLLDFAYNAFRFDPANPAVRPTINAYIHNSAGSAAIAAANTETDNKIITTQPFNGAELAIIKGTLDALATNLNFNLTYTADNTISNLDIYYDTAINSGSSSAIHGIVLNNDNGSNQWSELILSAATLSDNPELFAFSAPHELGHVFGLEHPFDGSDGDSHGSATSGATTADTVMAYTKPDANSTWPNLYTELDWQALSQAWLPTSTSESNESSGSNDPNAVNLDKSAPLSTSQESTSAAPDPDPDPDPTLSNTDNTNNTDNSAPSSTPASTPSNLDWDPSWSGLDLSSAAALQPNAAPTLLSIPNANGAPATTLTRLDGLSLSANAADNTLIAATGNRLDAAAGQDTLLSTTGSANTLFGGADSDILLSSATGDTLFGGSSQASSADPLTGQDRSIADGSANQFLIDLGSASDPANLNITIGDFQIGLDSLELLTSNPEDDPIAIDSSTYQAIAAQLRADHNLLLNAAPSLKPAALDPVVLRPGQAITLPIDALISDPDGDAASFRLSNAPAWISLSADQRSLTINTPAGFSTADLASLADQLRIYAGDALTDIRWTPNLLYGAIPALTPTVQTRTTSAPQAQPPSQPQPPVDPSVEPEAAISDDGAINYDAINSGIADFSGITTEQYNAIDWSQVNFQAIANSPGSANSLNYANINYNQINSPESFGALALIIKLNELTGRNIKAIGANANASASFDVIIGQRNDTTKQNGSDLNDLFMAQKDGKLIASGGGGRDLYYSNSKKAKIVVKDFSADDVLTLDRFSDRDIKKGHLQFFQAGDNTIITHNNRSLATLRDTQASDLFFSDGSIVLADTQAT